MNLWKVLLGMPYEITFRKSLKVDDKAAYINECCYGGDIVADYLRPALSDRFGVPEPFQEDWGWFLWFDDDQVRLAVDVFCDDPVAGDFRIHLTSRKKRWWRPDEVTDGPQLEELRSTIEAALGSWSDSSVRIVQLDRRYRPLTDESAQ